MSAEAVLEAAWALNPRTVERARRLVLAMDLLRAGMSRRDACALLQVRLSIGQSVAWKLVHIAGDMAGEENAP